MCVTGHQNADDIDLILRFSRFAFYLFASLLSFFQQQHESNCFFKTQRVYHRRNSMHAGSVVTRALMKTQNQRRLSWHFHTCNHTVQSWLSGLIKSDILSGCFDPFNSTGESGSLEARKTQYWPNDLQDICQVFFPKFMAGKRVPVTCCHSSQLMFEQFDQYLITSVNMYSVFATD